MSDGHERRPPPGDSMMGGGPRLLGGPGMVDIRNLDGYEFDPLVTYGGAAGQKRAMRMDGSLWMVKFPESTKSFPGRDLPHNHLPSYTTSPLSEYIGSHIYGSLGIPVHETLLGTREGKVVVACRDFVGQGRINDFASIKNTVSDDDLEHGTSSSGRGEYLTDALRVIGEAPIFEGMRDEVLRRFWDMFVVDSFILNNDRNNGNWGSGPLGSRPSLTPVYDNGQSFFNKKGNSVMERALDDPKAVWGDVKSSHSFYLHGDGTHVKPFDFLASTHDENAIAALGRFIDHVDLHAVRSIIEEIPENVGGMTVFPPAAKEFYVAAAQASLARGLVPAARAQGLPIPHGLEEPVGMGRGKRITHPGAVVPPEAAHEATPRTPQTPTEMDRATRSALSSIRARQDATSRSRRCDDPPHI